MDVNNTKILHGKLIELKDDCGYITYVFENIEATTIFDKYLMCVRFPNWNCPHLKKGDIGFVKYKPVVAGVDKWYDDITNTFIPYKFTDIHFINFVFDKPPEDKITM